MVLLPIAEAQEVHVVPDLLVKLRVPDPLWDAFVLTAGDPGNDLRLVAAMPAWAIPQIVSASSMASGERLTPIQAAQVGLAWRNARWVVPCRAEEMLRPSWTRTPGPQMLVRDLLMEQVGAQGV